MRAVEQAPRNKKQKESRAKPARRSFAFHSPRPQLLKGPTKESLSSKPKPSDGDFVAAIRGSVADAFFGASPVVASALGIRSGATPRGRLHSKPHPSALPRKEDISTLLGIGHFYFALTPGNIAYSVRLSQIITGSRARGKGHCRIIFSVGT
jgi:hypothetical protein